MNEADLLKAGLTLASLGVQLANNGNVEGAAEGIAREVSALFAKFVPVDNLKGFLDDLAQQAADKAAAFVEEQKLGPRP